MKIEIKIEPDLTESYAILHVAKLTAEIQTLTEILETADGQARVLMAKRDDKTFVLDAENIEIIRAEGGVTTLYDRQAQGFRIDKPLHELQKKLGYDFIRISKFAVVNIYRVDHVSPSFNGTMDIIMKNGMNDYISRKYLADFKKRLGL